MKTYLFDILIESFSAKNLHRSIFAIILVTVMGYPFFTTVAGVMAFNYCIVMLTDFIFGEYNINEELHKKEASAS